MVEDDAPSPAKRSAETPAEALDPRTEDYVPDPGTLEPGGVLQVLATVDEDPVEVPPEVLDYVEADDLEQDTPDHPDHWDEQRWAIESKAGKARELASLAEYGVYLPVPRQQSVGGKYITTRWEEVPKLKQGKWICRSRFVAREFRWKDPGRDDLFGVTSSSNTGRILDYLMVKKSLRAYLADCKCAFFHAPEEEEVYVEPPDEWKQEHPEDDMVWLLLKQLYGRRPAPRAFSDFCSGVLTDKIGMKRCAEVPHLFYDEETEVCLEVHVDDFYAVGPGEAAGNLLKRVAQYMTLTLEGPYDVGSTFVHLKRVRTMTAEGMYIAASPSHLRKLLKLTDLTEESKGRDTPITKAVVESETDQELSAEEWAKYRAVVGLLMYVSADRPDVQYVVNELSGLMSRPTLRAWEAAKHLVRYLIRTKDYALFFDKGTDNCDHITVMTDSDWATDRQSRKSKSAVHIYAGNCLLYSFTRRQTVIAQSSAEAEFYATASGVSEGVLIRKVLAFFGLVLGLQALTDSSANNAMTHRLGVGKIRHLETKVLWLQQLVYRGFLTMSWSPGRYNNSDLGTKVLGKARFLELVEKTGLRDLKDSDIKVQQVANVLSTQAGPSKEQIAQALAVLVGWLQVAPVKGQNMTEEVSEGPSMLTVLLLATFMIGVFAGCLGLYLWQQWRRGKAKAITFYKGPTSVVVHLDRSCHYLRKTKKVEEWSLCQWCSKTKLKLE